MQDPTREVQRGEPQVEHVSSYPRAEERPPFAMAEGGVPNPLQAQSPRLRSEPSYDSMADAMLPPRPADLPPIFAVPDVSPEQRSILRLAARLYRSENA